MMPGSRGQLAMHGGGIKIIGASAAISGVGSKTASTPPEAVPGDKLLAIFVSLSASNEAGPIPPGWTQVHLQSGFPSMLVAQRTVEASEPPSHTFNTSGTTGGVRGLALIAVRGEVANIVVGNFVRTVENVDYVDAPAISASGVLLAGFQGGTALLSVVSGPPGMTVVTDGPTQLSVFMEPNSGNSGDRRAYFSSPAGNNSGVLIGLEE